MKFNKVIGLLGIMAVGTFIVIAGKKAMAKTNEEPAAEVGTMHIVINEPPIVVEPKAAEPEPDVSESDPVQHFFNVGLTEDEEALFRATCEANNVDFAFAMALMESETNFQWVTGDTNLAHPSIGYFQINTINEERMADQYGLDIYDRFDNIEAGVHIIAELQEQFSEGYKGYFDTETAVIMGYKCGTARGTELMDDGIVLEVVQKIKNAKSKYED